MLAIDTPLIKQSSRLHAACAARDTNRGYGIQLEFSRAGRNLLFPPDCSRQARGRRSPRLVALSYLERIQE